MTEILFALLLVPLFAGAMCLGLLFGRSGPKSTCHAMACGGIEACAGCPRRAARKARQ